MVTGLVGLVTVKALTRLNRRMLVLVLECVLVALETQGRPARLQLVAIGGMVGVVTGSAVAGRNGAVDMSLGPLVLMTLIAELCILLDERYGPLVAWMILRGGELMARGAFTGRHRGVHERILSQPAVTPDTVQLFSTCGIAARQSDKEQHCKTGCSQGICRYVHRRGHN